MARIERGLRSGSRRMENRVSIQLSGTNSPMRVEKRKEELSQKRYSWIKMHSHSWESSSSRFRFCPTAERSRSARSTPTSAYGMGIFLLSCVPYSYFNLVESAVRSRSAGCSNEIFLASLSLRRNRTIFLEHQRVLYAVEKFLLKKPSLFEFVVQRSTELHGGFNRRKRREKKEFSRNGLRPASETMPCREAAKSQRGGRNQEE